MKRTSNKSGFTLLELLTVIAIIAILAAILFPVFKTVKDNAKKTSCLSNLHSIGLALQAYKLDNRRFPEFLLGPYTENPPGVAVPMSGARGGLYPEYVRSLRIFRCPAATDAGVDEVMPPLAAAGLTRLDSSFQPMQPAPHFYKGDSYEWAKYPIGVMATYTCAWAPTVEVVGTLFSPSDPEPTAPFDTAAKQARDYARQLRWRNPDAGTVVTWCINHNQALVLFLDGSVDTFPVEKMTPPPPGSPQPGPDNICYRELPKP
jgi:prepilin-type N-terminal cleavage/methylation domain-containing protein